MGGTRAERRERALTALAALSGQHLAKRGVRQMSGGERRRVHLARAIAVRPDLLLLDEPFSGLDSPTRSSLLRDAAAGLKASASASVVVVHDRTEAWALATRLVVLLDGNVAADGPPHQLLEDPPRLRWHASSATTASSGSTTGCSSPVPSTSTWAVGNRATVEGRLPQQDGVLLDLCTHNGRLQAIAPHPGPALGDHVVVDIRGGFRTGPAR